MEVRVFESKILLNEILIQQLWLEKNETKIYLNDALSSVGFEVVKIEAKFPVFLEAFQSQGSRDVRGFALDLIEKISIKSRSLGAIQIIGDTLWGVVTVSPNNTWGREGVNQSVTFKSH